ncbi:hypothetical protein HDZ31DRAFT_70234 [Schizophyllum fasciatum]
MLNRALQSFSRVPYGPDFSSAQITVITDGHDRSMIVRSVVQPWMLSYGLSELNNDVGEFVARCRVPFTEADMQGNTRGAHFFSICGIDRQSRAAATRSKFDVDNAEAISWFFRDGGPMRRFE